MNILIILSIFIAGLSGIVAQVLLLRELLISFLGNELTLGVILANWLIAEACGVFIAGKLIDKLNNKIDVFIVIQAFFSVSLPVSIYLARIFKPLIGVLPGETLGLPLIFLSSLFINFVPAFCHGALFSCGAKLVSSDEKQSVRLIGNLYAVETFGTIAGGVLLSYLLLPYFNSFYVAFMLTISNLVLCALFFRQPVNLILRYILMILIGAFICFALSGGVNKLQLVSIQRQFMPNRLLDYRNSVYGNIAVTEKEGQHTFFYNGIPVIITPFSDITFVEEFGNFPLLFHQNPEEILVLGAGMGGLLAEILKHPVKKVDYVELDPLITKMLKKFPSDITKKEFSDYRVNISNTDSRFFIRQSGHKYDTVLIGFTTPWDLSINRMFTSDFFSLLKARLKDKGVIAFCLPGSYSYISRELKDLNACILNAVKSNYAYIRVIPGDYNMFLASDDPEIMAVSPGLIFEKMSRLGIKSNMLTLFYLNYRLDEKAVNWFQRSLDGASSQINRDMKPYAVFQMLVLWNKQFSVKISGLLAALSGLSLKVVFLWVFLFTFLFYGLFKLIGNKEKLSVAYCVATTGFFSMLMNLVLIFSFQVFYGYIYQMIGALISVFMSGACLGSISMARYASRIKNERKIFILLEAAVIVFTLFSALTIIWIPGYIGRYSSLLFLILFCLSGMLAGLEFPLANKIYLKHTQKVGVSVGTLYFADLLGGSVAGILGGILLLPVLGVFNACMVVILFKLSSLVLLLLA